MMRQAQAQGPTPRLEGHADFVGPVRVVEAVGGGGRGRGLVTARDVRAGELLFACRATAVVFSHEVVSEGARGADGGKDVHSTVVALLRSN